MIYKFGEKIVIRALQGAFYWLAPSRKITFQFKMFSANLKIITMLIMDVGNRYFLHPSYCNYSIRNVKKKLLHNTFHCLKRFIGIFALKIIWIVFKELFIFQNIMIFQFQKSVHKRIYTVQTNRMLFNKLFDFQTI